MTSLCIWLYLVIRNLAENWQSRRDLKTDLRVTATNVIEAIKVHAKLTGEWVDLTEDIRREFEGKSTEEIRHHAEHGRWPAPNAVL